MMPSGIYQRMRATLPERIEFYSIPEPNSGCWLWTGSLTSGGYGCCWWDGKQTNAHRFSWLAYRGEIPSGQLVLHKCDMPSCVNPDHLFLGTAADNMRDMVAKGRKRGGAIPGQKFRPRRKKP